MGDKKLFDIDEFWKDLKLDKYGIEDIDEFEMDEIGKKIEESLDLEEFEAMEDQIEMPSPETFAKWVELGEDKYRKRLRRKRILGICATLLIVCIGAVVAINCIKPPVVDAGLEGGIDIESTDMETTNTYSSWSDLPQEIQDQFIEVKDLPDGYEVEQIEVVVINGLTKLKLELTSLNNNLTIRECSFDESLISTTLVPTENIYKTIGGVDVYIEEAKETNKKTYKYAVGDIVIDIITQPNMNEEDLVEIIINTQ